MKESTKEVVAAGSGACVGAGSAGVGVYAGGITGIRTAVQLTSGLKALGATTTLGAGGMTAGVISCFGLPVAGFLIGWGLYKLFKK